ncbi:MAG: c-type cytochrome, partial [Bryobacterales bacterium]|nr:c-type cytochrome [Bryobacterales bacterium]
MTRRFLLLLASIPVALPAWAQSPADIRPTYDKLCAGCHGLDARGTQQGPGLSGSSRLRRRNTQSIRNIIVKGVPSAGMPAFPLPEATVDGLVALVVSLNASAADVSVPGDRDAGRALFFGAAKCSSCHMVAGAGSAIGPDLSSVARELTVDQLRDAMVTPGASIANGYGLATVELGGGRTLRGFIRSRSRFDLSLQTFDGRLHPLSLDGAVRVVEERNSYMPAYRGSGADVQNLLAFLSGLTGVKPDVSAAPQPPAPGGVTFTDLLSPNPADWLTYNGSLSGNRYSLLKQINAANAGKLTLKWTFSIPLWQQFLPDTPYFRENMRYFGLETVPLVAGGIMYVTGPNQVFALDP